MTNKYYQLIVSKDAEFQGMIDKDYGRLAILPTRRNLEGKRIQVRASCKRLAHAGIVILDELSPDQLTEIAKTVAIIGKRELPDEDPKHTAIQLDKKFSYLARLKSASMEVQFDVSMSTAELIHYGMAALAQASDEVFQRVIYRSVELENGGSLRKYAFYDTP